MGEGWRARRLEWRRFGSQPGGVLIRRTQDAEKHGEPLPPVGSPLPVALADIDAFLREDLDDAKLEELIGGLSLVELAADERRTSIREDAELSRAYALIKLTLLPGKIEWRPDGDRARLTLRQPRHDERILTCEPASLARLRAGDVQGACEVAARRLRSSGFSPLGGFLADGARRAIDWSAEGAPADRLLACAPVPDS